jgi:predicted DNA-binding transcriptional regulator AlpA
MENDVTMVWLPLARVAEITGKSVKTIRRLVKEGSLEPEQMSFYSQVRDCLFITSYIKAGEAQ